jgi:hypothetical protein
MSRRPADPTRLRRGPAASRPSFRDGDRAPLAVREYPPPPELAARFLIPGVNSYLRIYGIGPEHDACSVVMTREYERWHQSIAHPRRLPTWDEVAFARYRFLPGDIVAAMVLPPLASYVNLHEFCLQINEIDDPPGERSFLKPGTEP